MSKKLTADLIQTRCKTDKLANIKNLNLWGNDLEDISIIKEMPNIEICSLSLNKINSLRDFASLKKLAELYLRKNAITDLAEAKHLQQCPQLKVLWLWDNPIAEHPMYRQYIIKLLPNLVKLDSSPVTQEERNESLKLSISEHEIAGDKPKTAVSRERGKSPSVQSSHSTPSQPPASSSNNHRNENILCAVLALLKELDESGLELVKRDIERKLQKKQSS